MIDEASNIMTDLATAIRAILFSIFIPGIVSVVFPIILKQLFPDLILIQVDGLKFIGYFVIILGVLGYIWTVVSFFSQGGTPQIYFMRKLQKIFGIEPDNLVNSGLYRYSRNPMYLSVATVILGFSLILNNLAVFLWFVIFFLLVNIVVVIIEEPHLKEKYGQSYEEYQIRTNRWFGRK